MPSKIYDVSVDKISLVTKNETPAVPKAGNKYAIFKVKRKDPIRKSKLKNVIDQLSQDPIKKSLKETITKLEDGDYLDIIMGGRVGDEYYTYNEWNERRGV